MCFGKYRWTLFCVLGTRKCNIVIFYSATNWTPGRSFLLASASCLFWEHRNILKLARMGSKCFTGTWATEPENVKNTFLYVAVTSHTLRQSAYESRASTDLCWSAADAGVGQGRRHDGEELQDKFSFLTSVQTTSGWGIRWFSSGWPYRSALLSPNKITLVTLSGDEEKNSAAGNPLEQSAQRVCCSVPEQSRSSPCPEKEVKQITGTAVVQLPSLEQLWAGCRRRTGKERKGRRNRNNNPHWTQRCFSRRANGS